MAMIKEMLVVTLTEGETDGKNIEKIDSFSVCILNRKFIVILY